MEPGPEVERQAREIVAGLPDDRAKLRALFTWVRDRIRYLAVEIGIGGFQPHPAEEISVHRYGDCKDMVTLLCALGRAVGLPIRQALISTRQNGEPDTSLPSPLHFNHVIAYAPELDGGVWMDPTEKGCAFGDLPWYDQGLPSLVIGNDGRGILLTTPADSGDANGESLDWWVTLGRDGAARIHGVWNLTGAPASDVRGDLLTASPYEHRQWLERTLADQLSGVRLDTFSITGMVPEDGSLGIAYAVSAPSFAVLRDSSMFLWPGRVAMSVLPDLFRSSFRTHPVQLRYGHRRELSMSIALPREFRAVDPSGADSVVSDFGWSRIQVALGPGRLTFHGTYSIRGETVPPGSYPEFQAFLDAVRRQDEREVILSP
jgi:hypothetical protein